MCFDIGGAKLVATVFTLVLESGFEVGPSHCLFLLLTLHVTRLCFEPISSGSMFRIGGMGPNGHWLTSRPRRVCAEVRQVNARQGAYGRFSCV